MEEIVSFLLLEKHIKRLINVEVWRLATSGAFPRGFEGLCCCYPSEFSQLQPNSTSTKFSDLDFRRNYFLQLTRQLFTLLPMLLNKKGI